MSRILILYSTTDGHTAKIAAALADTLRSSGTLVHVIDVYRGHPHPDDYGVIVAASVRGGKYQKAVERWSRPIPVRHPNWHWPTRVSSPMRTGRRCICSRD
jgi:menaquinone-dependent protoporphyrinogen oxidase